MYTASKRRPRRFQCSAVAVISSVRSRKVKPSNCECAESTAVGSTAHSTPMADMTGSAAVSEHLPISDMSCMLTIRFMFSPS